MTDPSRIRIHGPLTIYVEEFARKLAAQGYSDKAVAEHLRLMAHVSRWLEAKHLSVEKLTAKRVEAFATDRRAAGYHSACSALSLRPLMAFLQGAGVEVVREPEPPPLRHAPGPPHLAAAGASNHHSSSPPGGVTPRLTHGVRVLVPLGTGATKRHGQRRLGPPQAQPLYAVASDWITPTTVKIPPTASNAEPISETIRSSLSSRYEPNVDDTWSASFGSVTGD